MEKKDPDKPSFEDSMKELEALVERMESGELPLEESLAEFERGIALQRGCEAALSQAKQRVEILLSKTRDGKPETFDSES